MLVKHRSYGIWTLVNVQRTCPSYVIIFFLMVSIIFVKHKCIFGYRRTKDITIVSKLLLLSYDSLGWVLQHFFQLESGACRRAVSTMRTNGVRMDCVEKNIGKRQYAFNALQRSMLPEAYRCPEGTYGKGNVS